MLPGLYEFRWDTGHIIFLGAFYAVLLTVCTFLAVALWRARRDLRRREAEALLWRAEFHELPSWRQHCRHALTGELPERTCDRAFDCRACAQHRALLASTGSMSAVAPLPAAPAPTGAQVASARCEPPGRTLYGFNMPADRYYHRGHTWVRPLPDDLLEIGLDDFGARLVGPPDSLKLPRPGDKLGVNGTGWELVRNGRSTRVLAPVDGEVVDVGGPDDAWTLKVRPSAPQPDLSHLLRGPEVGLWLLDEIERLERLLAGRTAIGSPIALADGGVPAPDFPAAVPDADWDAVYGEMFLEA